MLFNSLKIRTLALALLALAFTVAAHAQSTPEAAVGTFMDGFNSGDMAKSAAVNSASGTSIIDESGSCTCRGSQESLNSMIYSLIWIDCASVRRHLKAKRFALRDSPWFSRDDERAFLRTYPF